jgi:hypothetical protein
MTTAVTRIHEAADAEEVLVSARAQLRHHREVMAHMADDAGPLERWAINGLAEVFARRVARLEAIAEGRA